jgi:hypothetical protein
MFVLAFLLKKNDPVKGAALWQIEATRRLRRKRRGVNP